jgi:ABC-type Mn2+/Zn2+ transport system permease subunit
MILATIFIVIYIVLGLALSFAPNLPAGSMIIMVAGGGYIAGMVVKRIVRK